MNPALPLVEELLHNAITTKATDLHFFPARKETNVFFRIHGKRVYHRSIPTSQYELLLTYFKFTAGMDIGESRKPQDGSIFHHFSSLGRYSLRLSTLPLASLESLAIRILPEENLLPLDKLFLFPNQLNTLKKWLTKKEGIILITGPTGSGKTTTLYALIKALMENNTYQMITLEDPVEKLIDGVIQVQINEQAGITYQTGLKAALRHDPDVLMIGELRDATTTRFAFQASLTGHLVLSTLHAKNTTGTIYRLLEMGINQQDLLQSLLAVASIQLVPIKRKDSFQRAAILELLDGDELARAIRLEDVTNKYHSFDHLRRKAYAYGFFSEVYDKETRYVARRNPNEVS